MKNLAFGVLLLFAASAFAARPIARWDVIPYQRVSGTFKAGVVAFHEKGVKVQFSVNGKQAFTADHPTLNPRTKVWEYVFAFDASKFDDGLVKLGAKAITEGEKPYELPELELYANSKKTQGSRKRIWVDPVNGNEFADGSKDSPVKSLKQALAKAGDGGTVFLLPGKYHAKMMGGSKDNRFWTLVCPAKGVKRSQVKILGGRSGSEKIHFKNVELYSEIDSGYGTIMMGEGGATMAWFDNCRFYNKGGRYGGSVSVFGNRLRAFVTGGSTSEVANGPFAELIRGHSISTISCDALPPENSLVVNTTVDGIDATGTAFDPDLFNGFASGKNWAENVILYNIKATDCKAKGISGHRMRNCAFVNIVVEGGGGTFAHSIFSEEVENCLFAHITFVDQELQMMKTKNRTIDFIPQDVRFFNCVYKNVEGYETSDGSKGLTVRNSAYYNRDEHGKQVTFGENAVKIERLFPGEAEKNYALPDNSPARDNGIYLQSIPADINGVPYPDSTRPCGAYAK